MSDFPSPASSLAHPAPFRPEGGYQLSDDLARLCLPREFKDAYRTLAWVNSVCALFLVIGMVGFRAPKVIERPLSEINEPVPVIFTPPEEQPKQVTEQPKPDEPEPTDTPAETPQVVTMVAPADAKVAFSVPVQGAVMIAPTARAATPPPAVLTQQEAPKTTRFNPNVTDGGFYPPPQYPGAALRNRYQGTVLVGFAVDEMGKVSGVEIRRTSGFSGLDEAATEVVKNRWRFPPGAKRIYEWPCVFKLQ